MTLGYDDRDALLLRALHDHRRSRFAPSTSGPYASIPHPRRLPSGLALRAAAAGLAAPLALQSAAVATEAPSQPTAYHPLSNPNDVFQRPMLAAAPAPDEPSAAPVDPEETLASANHRADGRSPLEAASPASEPLSQPVTGEPEPGRTSAPAPAVGARTEASSGRLADAGAGSVPAPVDEPSEASGLRQTPVEAQGRPAVPQPVRAEYVEQWVQAVKAAVGGETIEQRVVASEEQTDAPTMGWSYEIQPGDTLWAITVAAWSTIPDPPDVTIDTCWRLLYQFNQDVLGSNPNLVYPGQVIQIPADATSPSSP